MALNPELFTPATTTEGKTGDAMTLPLDAQVAALEAGMPGYFVSSLDTADDETPVTIMYLREITASGGGSTLWQGSIR